MGANKDFDRRKGQGLGGQVEEEGRVGRRRGLQREKKDSEYTPQISSTFLIP